MLDEGFPANSQSEASANGFLHEVYHNHTLITMQANNIR